MQRKSLVAGNINFLKNFVIIYLLIFLFVFSIATTSFITKTISADSNNYYVSTNGNNGNNGLSPGTAWATLEYAMTKTSPGDTVYVMAGTYIDPYITTWGANSGTAGNFITYMAYGNGEVILDATGSSSFWSGAIWIDSLKYIRLSGFTIRGSSSHGILVECSSSASNNIIIDNCKIYDCSSSGICFAGGVGSKRITDLVVENNIIYNCQNNWFGTRTQEVVTFSSCSNFVFRNNYVYNGRIALIDVKNSCTEGYLYNNQIDTSNIYEGSTYGFYVDAGNTYCSNLYFYNNIAWGAGSGYVLASEAGGNLADISFYNNIYKGTQNAFKIDRYTTAGTHDKINLQYINNVIASGSTAFQFLEDDADIINLIVRNNIVQASTGFYVPHIDLDKHNIDHNLYNVQTSDYYGSNSINSNPYFVNPSNGDFHLLANSPAIDAGSLDDAPLDDFDGTSRPQGIAIDIGAFEFISTNNDNTLPQISQISITTSTPLDTTGSYGWENISCTVTDNLEVDTVYIKIVPPNNNQINIEMTKIANSDKYYYNSSWFNHGDYSYYIQAIDTSNNNKYSQYFYFSLPPNWDINNDGKIGILDLIRISIHFNQRGPHGWIREDVDNNGIINLLDLGVVSNYYGEIWST